MTVYPAAIELSQSGFDISHLVSLPTYSEGGPNLHSLSLVTWLVATVFYFFGTDTSTYVLLHIAFISIAAVGLWGFYSILRLSLSPSASTAATLLLALWPTVMRQFGSLYLETPLFTLSVWIGYCLLTERIRTTSLLLAVGAAIKLSAALLLMGAAVFLLARPGGPRRHRVPLVAAALAPATILGIALYMVQPTQEWGGDVRVLAEGAIYIATMPFELALIAALLFALFLVKRGRLVISNRETFQLATINMLSYAVFYIAIAFLGHGVAILPRYYILFVPWGLVALTSFRFSTSRNLELIAAYVLMPIMILGQTGALIPYRDIAAPSFAERYNSAPALVTLHRQMLGLAESLPPSEPVYYSRYFHFLNSYPDLGYVAEPLPNGLYASDHEDSLEKGSLPKRFHLLYDFPWLGAELLIELERRMEADPDHTVTTRHITVGPFTGYLVTIER